MEFNFCVPNGDLELLNIYDVFDSISVRHLSCTFWDPESLIYLCNVLSRNTNLRRFRFAVSINQIVESGRIRDVAESLNNLIVSNVGLVEIGGPIMFLLSAYPDLYKSFQGSHILSILDVMNQSEDSKEKIDKISESCWNNWAKLMKPHEKFLSRQITAIITSFCGVIIHCPDYDATGYCCL